MPYSVVWLPCSDAAGEPLIRNRGTDEVPFTVPSIVLVLRFTSRSVTDSAVAPLLDSLSPPVVSIVPVAAESVLSY